MRIGIDIRGLEHPERTGVGEFTIELLSHIFAQDITNEYYLFSNAFTKPATPAWVQSNVQTITTAIPNKLLTLTSALCNQPQIDRLISRRMNAPLDLFFSPNLNTTSLSTSVKHILMIHDISFIFFPNFFTPKQRLKHFVSKLHRQIARAAAIVVPSHNTKRDCVEHLNIAPEKITVLYPGIPTALTKPDTTPLATVKTKYHLPDKYILFISTLEPRKNVLNLVRGFEQAANHLPLSYHLVLAGAYGSQTAALKKRIAASPLRSRIQVLGYVDSQDKRALYTGASLLAYPSLYEGFGFPVLEAMSVGTPVLTSNRSSLPEVTNNAAYLINPHFPEEIAEGIERILNNTTFRHDLIQKGTVQSQTFSWQRTATDWLALANHLKP